MKICFVASGPKSWGSARMRAYWPAEYMADAVVVEDLTAIPDDYDAYIWQKVVHQPAMQAQRARGAQVWWDLCDPTWWFSPGESKEIAQLCTGFVASSQALAKDFEKWSGRRTHTIPDRLKLDHYARQRLHRDTQPVRLIWYGVAINRIALFGGVANLQRLHANGHQIELTIFDDRPEQPVNLGNEIPVYQVQWSLETENQVLAAHDIAFLPHYPGPWGLVKSNNKTLTAWACGLPVANGMEYEYLRLLVESAPMRQERAHANLVMLDMWRVEQSARDWEALLC